MCSSSPSGDLPPICLLLVTTCLYCCKVIHLPTASHSGPGSTETRLGMLPAHGKAGAGIDGTQLQKKYIFIRKALCRGARLSHTKLIPPTPLDGMQEPEGPPPSINSASSWPGAAPRRRVGRVASVETSSTPLRHAPAVESCAWRAPGQGSCCQRWTWGTSLALPRALSSSSLPLPCSATPTDRSGAREASGSVTAEYTVGTSSTTSAAYAVDNTATKKGEGRGIRHTRSPPGLAAGPAPGGPAPRGEGGRAATRAGSRSRAQSKGPGPRAGGTKAKREMSEVEGDKGRIKALPVPPAQSRLPRSLVVLANAFLPGMRPVRGRCPVPGHCTA